MKNKVARCKAIAKILRKMLGADKNTCNKVRVGEEDYALLEELNLAKITTIVEFPDGSKHEMENSLYLSSITEDYDDGKRHYFLVRKDQNTIDALCAVGDALRSMYYAGDYD